MPDDSKNPTAAMLPRKLDEGRKTASGYRSPFYSRERGRGDRRFPRKKENEISAFLTRGIRREGGHSGKQLVLPQRQKEVNYRRGERKEV